MKKQFIIPVLILLALRVNGQVHELSLSKDAPYLSPAALLTWAEFFHDRFWTKNGQFNRYNYEAVSVQDLFDMESTVLTTHDAEANVTDSGFFHVLRIFYGLDTTTTPYSIRLIFLPDRAIHTTANTYRFEVNYPLADAQQVYLADDIKTPVAYSTVKGYVDNYHRSGYLKLDTIGNGAEATMRTLNFTGTANGDAEGIVFPLQEIHYYFTEGNIYFYSLAEIDAGNSVKFFKHKLAIADSAPGGFPSAISANLGALCPPRCQDIRVNTIVREVENGFVQNKLYLKVISAIKNDVNKSRIQ